MIASRRAILKATQLRAPAGAALAVRSAQHQLFSSKRRRAVERATGGRPRAQRQEVMLSHQENLPENAWVPVTDEASGQVYWWNQSTNETTALGAPKPTTVSLAQQAPQQIYQQGQQPTMGQAVGGMFASGIGFGVGSSVAHHAIGSMFGGSSAPGPGSSGDMGGGDTFDI